MEKLLSKRQVCELIGISTRTFDRWRALWSGKGIDVGEVKIRNTVRFRPARVRQIIDTKRLWL